MNKLYSIFFLLFLMAVRPAAQTPFFKTYTLGEIHKDVRINHMLERHNGYLWFGTTEGVFRYDGLQFEQFLMPDTLTSNKVTAFYEDDKKSLWIGLDDGAIFFENEQKKLTKWEPGRRHTKGSHHFISQGQKWNIMDRNLWRRAILL